MTALIQLDDVTKDYGRFRALDHVTLEIPPGITGVLGPNGAGKSTLIKVLLGLLKSTSGSGRFLDYRIGRDTRQIRASVGYMPEDDCFLYGLTGVESVQFSAQLSRIPRVEALRRSHEILDFCGAGQERYRAVETYSTGMRQKLRFAQALVHDPPFLILDEPTSGLDPEERDAMLLRIKRLAEDHGKGVLICTHILPDVQDSSDHIVILSGGRVLVSDSLETLSRVENPSVKVNLRGDRNKFIKRLGENGFTVSEESGETLAIGGGTHVLSARLWSLAADCNVSINSLTPSRNSLEDIFISAVTGQSA